MKKTISLFLVVAFLITLIPTLTSCSLSQDAFNSKMDKWVSLLNYDGLTDDEINQIRSKYNSNLKTNYVEAVDALTEELKLLHRGPKLAKEYSEHKGYPYADKLCEYVKGCDINRLIQAARNLTNCDYYSSSSASSYDSYPSSEECIYTAIYNALPELFIKPIIKAGINSGYYIDNPEGNPGVSHEEPSEENENYTNTYVVKHYGDFAILESKVWKLTAGRLEWDNGVFYDEPGQWITEEKTELYYKGNDLITLKNWRETIDINSVLIYEGDKYIYCFCIIDRGVSYRSCDEK